MPLSQLEAKSGYTLSNLISPRRGVYPVLPVEGTKVFTSTKVAGASKSFAKGDRVQLGRRVPGWPAGLLRTGKV